MVHVVTLLVTRNKSCHVRTLHSLLQMNVTFIQSNIHHEICFVNDDPFEKADIILKKLKSCDRLIFIDYSVSVDRTSIGRFLEKYDQNCHCMVFPCVKEGIDWELFKSKVKDDVDEPIEQMALDFDTKVSQKVSDGVYKVVKTEPKCWVMDSKSVLRHLKTKKKEPIKNLPAKNSELFETLQSKGVKINAFVDAQLITVYSHECLGNILNASGVKVN